MKNLLYLALLVVTVSFGSCNSSSNTQKTDWDEWELKGKVKELTITVYEAHSAFGELQKDNIWYSKQYHFTEDGKYSYVLEGKGSMLYDWRSEYSYSGNEVVVTYYKNDFLNGKSIVTFNENGDIKRMTLYDSAGKEKEKEEYLYNEKNQLVEKSYYRENELRYKDKDYVYNAEGLVKSYKTYNQDGLDHICQLTYDSQGRVIKNESYEPDGSKNIYSSVEKTYNQEGFLSSIKYADNPPHEYTYKYDSKGNFIIRNDYGMSSTIEERKIVYY